MTTLNYKPLRHMSSLDDTNSPNYKELLKPGVYIWGFLYKKRASPKKAKKNKLCIETCLEKYNWEILNCNKGKKNKNELEKALKEILLATEQNEICSNYLFVPYYVGISTNISKGVKVRLEEHRKMDNGHSAKYVRLKEEFMKCYHKHLLFLNSKEKTYPSLPVFPILKGTLNNNHVWTLLAEQGYVYHFNRQSACYIIDHNQQNRMNFNRSLENGNYSINDYNRYFGCNSWIEENDPLKCRVKKNNGYNNFWFTYCEFSESSNQLHQAEAATYFALRGITFSRTHTLKLPAEWNIDNNSGFDIFLDNKSHKTFGQRNSRACDPSDQFNWPGYW